MLFRSDDFLGEEFKKYIANEPYDPLAICAYTRNKIEENTYNLLHTEQEIFLDTNTTGEKLKKALETGVEIPESYFLLRIIYDEAMHSSTSKNNLSAIEAKLSNPIIKQMIIDAVNTVQGEK